MKKLRILLSIIICLNIVIMIIIVTMKNINKKVPNNIMTPYNIEEYKSEKLAFGNSQILLRIIKGTNFKASKIMGFTELYIKEYLPKLYNDIMEDAFDENEYYNKNKQWLLDKLNIKSEEELKEYIKLIQTKDINFNNYSSVYFDENTGTANKRELTINIKVNYENNKQIEVKISTDINYNISFKIL